MSSPLKPKPVAGRRTLDLLLAIATTTGHPQQVPFLSPPTGLYSTGSITLKVAIIGGGPAGTSAGFFLSKFANASGNSIEVHIFERSDYLGGRLITLHQAVRDFNLTLEPPLSTSTDGQDQNYAIWDGTNSDSKAVVERVGHDQIILAIWKSTNQLNGIRQRVSIIPILYSNEFVRRGHF
ncbi:hypothetical protein H4Q26_001428 [Puccinia striiformis f. sp. tritici PST-130]|nr:hypothetical protein H4Q26_001428 [Puccinia striiformis f. sp. tritici PST-130]